MNDEIRPARQSSHGLSSYGLSTGAHDRRRRILVSAYLFSPVMGSEQGVGWNICSRLSAYHDVTVLTRSWDEKLWPGDEKHREDAERFMRERAPIPGLTIKFVDSPALSRLLQPRPHVSLRSPFHFQGYAAWQQAAYREAVRLHREQPFDVTHQLTVATFREPGYLWKLGVPFIWGPIGGGENIPWTYFADFGVHDSIYYALKNVANNLHVWTKRRSRIAARRAERVLVTSAQLHEMLVRWGGTPQLMLEVGAPDWSGRPRYYDGLRPLRLCWIGLHIGRKALPIFLRVLRELKTRGLGEKVHLAIMGSGPETGAWQALCRKLGVQEMTTWMGQVPFQQVHEEMDRQDALVMSSVQDSTSTVLMEALASGLPVICHDISGMSHAIDENLGNKVPLRDLQTSVLEFADAITRLVTTRGLLDRLSEGALRRAKTLSWDENARQIARGYDSIASINGLLETLSVRKTLNVQSQLPTAGE